MSLWRKLTLILLFSWKLLARCKKLKNRILLLITERWLSELRYCGQVWGPRIHMVKVENRLTKLFSDLRIWAWCACPPSCLNKYKYNINLKNPSFKISEGSGIKNFLLNSWKLLACGALYFKSKLFWKLKMEVCVMVKYMESEEWVWPDSYPGRWLYGLDRAGILERSP